MLALPLIPPACLQQCRPEGEQLTLLVRKYHFVTLQVVTRLLQKPRAADYVRGTFAK
jgi:hypothetical protein